MPEFNPDEFLVSENNKEFNPDEFLSSENKKEFNPGEFLSTNDGKDVNNISTNPQAQQEKERSFIDSVAAFAEPALTIGTGAIADVVGGLSGIAPALMGNPIEAEQNINAVKDALTYQPRTDAGKEALQSTGEFLQPVGEVLQTIEDKFSESGAGAFEAIGLDPALGAATGAALPAAISSIAGAAPAKTAASSVQKLAIKTGDNLASNTIKNTIKKVVPDFILERDKAKKNIINRLQNKDEGADLAGKALSRKGKIIKDKQAIKAIKQGFSDGVISVAKNLNSTDKKLAKEMLKNAYKGSNNTIDALNSRTWDTAGKSLIKRVRYITAVNKRAGRKIDKEAQKLRGQVMEIGDISDNLVNGLSKMDVKLDSSGKLDFRGSDISGIAPAQSAIRKVVSRLKDLDGSKKVTAYDLHKVKRHIDELVNYGAKKDGLSGKTERVLKDFRKKIDKELDNKFPEYDAANNAYAETIKALGDIRDIAGKKVDILGKNAGRGAGTTLRGMLNNTKGSEKLIKTIDSLDSLSKKYGAKFKDDIRKQVVIADEFDSIFGTAAKTSLQGVTEKAINATKGAGNATVNPTGAAIDIAKSVAGNVAGRLSPKNKEEAFKAMMRILN